MLGGYQLPLTNDQGGPHWPRASGPGARSSSSMAAHHKWDLVNTCVSSVLGLLGLVLAVVISGFPIGPLRVMGQVVGLGNFALGLFGLLTCLGLGLPPSLKSSAFTPLSSLGPGSSSGLGRASKAVGLGASRASLRTALLVGLAWAAISSTSLMSQLSTDIGVHCGLAESFVRISHLEAKLTAVKHDEMMTQVFFRLNELDDMLDLVHEGAVGVGEARALMHSAKHQDKEYISLRINRLQKHAESVAAGLRSRALEVKANLSSSWQSPGSADSSGVASSQGQMRAGSLPLHPMEGQQKQSQEALWLLEKRIEAVDSVVQYLDAKHTAGDLSFEEYEVILSALVEGGSAGVGGWAAGSDIINVEALKKDQSELHRLKEAFGRWHSQQYSQVAEAGPHMKAVQEMKKKRDNARHDFEARFMGVLDQHSPVHPASFHDSLVQALDDLPAHCISEVKGYAALWWIVAALLAAQMLAAHAALTAVVHVAALKDD